MNKNRLNIIASALLLTTTLGTNHAIAGWQKVDEVQITHSNGIVIASGGLAAARNSADDKQYIGCTTYGMPGSGFGACLATTADGEHLACYTDDADTLAAMRAINSDGAVMFVVNKGETDCNYVVVENLSVHRP